MAPTYDVDALKARTEDNARDAYHFSQRQLDRVVDPSTRENAYAAASDFAHERPLLSVRTDHGIYTQPCLTSPCLSPPPCLALLAKPF